MQASSSLALPRCVAVVGGGPAGLMAAQTLAQAGVRVSVFEAMPSLARKFLLAGKGGLNLTHSEPLDRFMSRYGGSQSHLEPMLQRFGPEAVRAWTQSLGIETFVGSSGRVFPKGMKTSPLLRAWLQQLHSMGVQLHARHRWVGFAASVKRTVGLRFLTEQGEKTEHCDAVVLALGGGSWPRMGSNGAWVPLLQQNGVQVAPLQPANCGFEVAHPQAASEDAQTLFIPGWSHYFRDRFAGQPLKNVALFMQAASGISFAQAGEFVVTARGIEGSLVYALSSLARDTIAAQGHALLHIDLLPARSPAFVHDEVARPRGSRSWATHLKSRLGIDGVKLALLHELLPKTTLTHPAQLASALKAVPLRLLTTRPLAEAISSAGGVPFEELTPHLMLRALPGVFCAGEMLNWEAPTGGHLLTACLATGMAAGAGVVDFLNSAPAQ